MKVVLMILHGELISPPPLLMAINMINWYLSTNINKKFFVKTYNIFFSYYVFHIQQSYSGHL